MKGTPTGRLLFRRQYILAPSTIKCPFEHNEYALSDNYWLYVHLDLPVTHINAKDATLFILGDIFDSKNPEKSNHDIANDLVGLSYHDLLDQSGMYTGRYAFILKSQGDFIVFHDATATRKVFFCKILDKTWLASLPYLLAHILDLKTTQDPEKKAFYTSEDHKRLNDANIGNTTIYDEIRQLMPNHFLDVGDSTTKRFWPRKFIEHRPIQEVARECAMIIKGSIEAIALRYDIMLPVTAGHDSRLLLAATKDIRDKVYYYINQELHLSSDSKDIAIPRRLFRKLNLDFHIEELKGSIDPNFKDIFYHNNPYASKEYIPHIQNYFFKFPDKINLPGNFAAASWGINRLSVNRVSGVNLARMCGLERFPYAIRYYDQWLKGCQEICLESNINVIRLFYWEERIANWGSQIAIYKDVAQEEFNPLNSRYLLYLFHSVKQTHNNWPDHQLHRAIIKDLWPELLSIPMNPSFQRGFLKTMKFLGLFRMVTRLKNLNTYE